MSTSLARLGANAVQDAAIPWTPLRSLMGFDPFQNLRNSYGYDYDVSRTDTGYEVEVPVPGYTADQIEVAWQDGVLTVAGKSERRSFTRSFTIPEDVDVDAIQAKVTNGMLLLNLQRRPEAQPKRIHVRQP